MQKAISLVVIALFAGCYTYRVVGDLEDVPEGNEIRITTQDAKVFDLHSWQRDSAGVISGYERMADEPASLRRLVKPKDIMVVEQREFDQTTSIIAAVLVGVPLVQFFIMAATWDR